MPYYQVTRTDGPGDDEPPRRVTHAQVLVFALRESAKYLGIAADALEEELHSKGIDTSEAAQADAVARSLVAAIAATLD
jgi:hypothetical protein